jgi:hypothetical protein
MKNLINDIIKVNFIYIYEKVNIVYTKDDIYLYKLCIDFHV